MNKIIERIATLRDERGWTIYRLSVEANIGTATILNWFKRDATPKLDAIQAVCNAFGITLVQFFNFKNEYVSLSETQKKFLAEYDQLNNDEKNALLELISTMNSVRKKIDPKRN